MIRKKSRQARFVFATVALTTMGLGTAVNLHAQNCDPPPAGLVSWWPGETNAVDIAGTNNGAVQGGLTFVGGEVGQAFSFNGTDADVMVPASSSLNVGAGSGLTVDAWIKPADLVERPIVEWDSASDFLTHFRYSSPAIGGGNGTGCLYADLKDTGGVNHTIASAAGLISSNIFQHIAVTYDKASGVATLYLNGAVVAQQTLGSFTPDTTGNLYLGLRAAGAGTGQRYQGLLDEVDVFNRALSGSEIQAIYNASSTGKCKVPVSCVAPPTGLISWWPGETNALDIAGTNNGVLQGGLTFVAGEVGQAFNFNGTDADVKIPASASLNVGAGNGLTIDVWIKPNDVSNQRPLLEWNSGTHDAHLWIATPVSSGGSGPGSLYANLRDTNGNDHIINSAPGIIATNFFQHVALTYDKSSGTAVLYLNGAVVAQQNLGVFTPKTTADLYFGLRPFDAGAGLRFYGLMDEVDLYSRALSSSEIQAIYNAGSAGKCKGPVPPSITTQPQSQTVFEGNDATFTMIAGGTLPLGYQWYFNVTNFISGATNSSLTVFNVQTNNAGSYSVIVSNVAASTPSSNAMLTVDLPVCDAPPSGLISWWLGENDANDAVGTNNGLLQGGMAFAPGKVGQAFSFNGSNASVTIPATTSLNVGTGSGFTIDAWIKPGDVSTQRPLTEWNDLSGLDRSAHFWIAVPVFSGGGGPGCLYANFKEINGTNHIIKSVSGLITTNSFQHVALTYDKTSGNAALYLNGVAITQTNLGIFIPNTASNLYFGLRPAGSVAGTRFSGLMDEMSLYNRALSAAEIQNIYNASTVGKCTSAPTTAPSILIQPQSQTVTPGTNITLTVLAAGSTPLQYQWRYNGTNVPGATTAALYLTNVQPSQAGNYSVVITNALNANTPLVSSNATLKVNVVLVMGNGQPLTNSQYTFIGPTTIQLQNAYPTGLVYYTLNGATPSFNSSQYSGQFVVSNNVIVRALGYSPDFSQSGQTDPIALSIVPAYSLTLTTAGGGAVSANPPVGPYTNGAIVTLTAHPESGWTFFQWLGDASGTNTTNSVTIDRNESVRAVFGTILSTTAAPTGSGSVMLNPPGGLYPYGTTVLISALPQPGNYFVVWDNAPGASGNANPLSYTVTNPNPTVSSLFAALNSGQVSLAVVPVGRGKVGVNPSGNTFSLNQSVTVTATPDAGQSFVNWSGNASGAQNPLPVTLTQSKTIYANFSKAGALSFQPLGLRSLSEGFELTLNGEYGTAYRIDGSTNLTTWVPLITLTNSFGTLQFIDYSTSNNFSDRYYRAVPLP